MDTKALVTLCQKGNGQALSLLYENYSEKMLKVCLRYIPDPTIAQDLLHDGFVIIFTSIHSLRNPEKLEYWMKKIMRNLALQYLNQMTGTIIPLSVHVRSHGKYTFKVSNPSLFMQTLAGTANVYRKDQLIEQIRSDVIDAFQNVLNELGNSKHKIPVLELPSQTDEIKQIMAESVFDEPLRKKGLEITGFNVESLTLDDESKKKIDSYELSSNSYMQQGRLVESYADAVKGAANNANGAANGFMGIGMMNMASNGMMGGVAQGPWQNAPAPQQMSQEDIAAQTQPVKEEAPVQEQNVNKEQPSEEQQTSENTVEEPKTRKFCPECGTKLEEGSKFCPECGKKLE